jgi:1,4-alpha-glucan branching enzyme
MKSLDREQGGAVVLPQNPPKPVNFYCHAPDAALVELLGDFNDWTAVPMQRRADGWWYLSISLTHGHHRYRFLVDGTPTLDPHSTGVGQDETYGAVSIIAVS